MSDTDPSPFISARETGWRSVMLALTAILGIAVLVALVATLNEANRQRDRALALQAHSFQVMILVRTLATTMAEAEASLGRYVISGSGDKQLGQIYSEQWSQASDQINQLRELTVDNRAQTAKIDALRRAYAERSNELTTIALSTRYAKNQQALSLFYRARQSPSLSRIRELLEEIIDRERALLAARTNDAMHSVDSQSQVARVLIGFGVAIVLGAIALGWLTIQAFGQRAMARAEVEAERERSHELERAVAAATAELRHEAAERAAAVEQLRQIQKMEAVGQLTGGIAHDFNNMLAVVLGGLELARRRLTDKDAATRHVENATEGAKRAIALTRRLLAFSRAEALLPEAIDASDLISGMSDLLDRTLGGAIVVDRRAGNGDWLIWADRHQLENALLNLAVNARDAMEGRGTLTFATGSATLKANAIGECAAGDYVTVAVTDTGCGMTPEVLERVFEPFFTTKPIGKGTGLGLSQIFAFVRQSDGEITMESTPGVGTTVTLYLPRYRGEAPSAPAPDVVTLPTQPEPAETAGYDVLVVEDDPRVLNATLAALQELGHRPIACGDPLAALAMAEAAERLDLVLSDVRMPGKTGPEVIAELTPRFPDIAVLFVTGFTGDAGSHEFDGHIVLRKPFTIAGLARAIDDAMAAHRARRVAA
ncbi:ATP-binding protein [Sphingomonas sp. GlSt437]|uniref:ATP-binding protein n=1 Tax=Sphingomonas sp. GlSt437 TaxID=3389970 RepID=UPI003A8A3CEB